MLAPVGIVVAVVVGVNVLDGGSGGAGDPTDPFSTLVQPDDSTTVWEVRYDYDEPRPMVHPVDGSGRYGRVTSLVVGDVLVQRLAQDRYDSPAESVVALGLGDGEPRWELDLPGAVCDAVPGSLAAPSRLVCAGDGEAGPSVAVLDAASGGTTREWTVPSRVQLIRATADGVVTVDAADPETGRSQVRWYTQLGALRWAYELQGSELVDAVEDDDEEGWQISSRLEILPAGDSVALSTYDATLLGSADGAEVREDCDLPQVTQDGLVCWGYPETYLLRNGEKVWAAEDLELLSFDSERYAAPALIHREFGDFDDDPRRDTYSWVDPETGRVGAELIDSATYVRGFGDTTYPVLLAQEDTDDYDTPTATTLVLVDPATGTAAWTVELEARSYTDVAVVGDRVLVEIDYGSWTVLDAATGAVVGGVASTGSAAWVDLGGDAVVGSGSTGLKRIQLP